jgi:O-acetyl-ADP-ribose deacetylase (regulator of RNase III)
MPTRFVAGDLFCTNGLGALAHGCNCAGAMNKGIAAEFRRRFPTMYSEYKRRCTEQRFRLGDVFQWDAPDRVIFNLGTQQSWKTKADLKAIETAVREMIGIAKTAGIGKIGLPRIGAGLGGLPWEGIRSLLSKLGQETDVELVVFEEYVAGVPAFLDRS